MSESACFTETESGYQPLDLARSYWRHDALGGRAVVGLLGHEIERLHGSDTGIPARLTVDMFRLAPFTPLEIHSRIIRDGRRLRLVEADLVANGETVARASCQILEPVTPPPGRAWSPALWASPHPDMLPGEDNRPGPRAFDLRWVSGSLGSTTEKGCWIRERFTLIEGKPLSPFARIALAADYASPFTNAGDAGIRYMNTDITLQLHRLPEGAWIGFEATGHEASQGIAVGHCRLHDVTGPVGFASATALANERRRS